MASTSERAAAPAAARRTHRSRGPLVIGRAAPAFAPRLDASGPYRPDTVLDGGDAFGLTVRAASVRGLAKRFVGGPRQDDICLALHAPTATLLAAVADGVSAAPESQLGAALATRHALAAAARELDEHAAIDWERVFANAAWSLVETHRTTAARADADAAEAAERLATTLLVAAVNAPDEADADAADVEDGREPRVTTRVQLACAGDSSALLLEDWRFTRVLGGDPDGELLGTPVSALPRNAGAVATRALELEPGAVLLLGSDGFALPLADGRNDVGAVFARALVRPPNLVDFARLLDFSRSSYDDDRSLIAIWPPRGR